MEAAKENTTATLKYLWERRGLIVKTAVVAAVLSFITTFFVSPKYKSVSRVYPANLQLFSGESPTEQLLQWMESGEVKKLFMNNNSFNLLKHYDIDGESNLKEHLFNLTFDEKFIVKNTEYQSIEISVIDKDPAMAQQLNYAYIAFTDSLIRKAHSQKLLEFTAMLNSAMKRQVKRIDSLKNGLYRMAAQYNLTDYKIQLKEVNKNYLKQLGNGKESKELKVLLDNLGQKGPDQYLIVRMIETEIDHYNTLRVDYESKLKDLNKYFTYSVVVQKPMLPDDKFWPKKGLIIFTSVLSTVALLIVLLLFSAKKTLVHSS